MACRQDWGLQRLGALEREGATGLGSISGIVPCTRWQYRLASLCSQWAKILLLRIWLLFERDDICSRSGEVIGEQQASRQSRRGTHECACHVGKRYFNAF